MQAMKSAGFFYIPLLKRKNSCHQLNQFRHLGAWHGVCTRNNKM